MDKLYTIEELAALLKVSKGILYKWVKQDKIPYIDLSSKIKSKKRMIRFNLPEILDYFKKDKK